MTFVQQASAGVVPGDVERDAVAMAVSLTTIGYAMFALMQPGPLPTAQVRVVEPVPAPVAPVAPPAVLTSTKPASTPVSSPSTTGPAPAQTASLADGSKTAVGDKPSPSEPADTSAADTSAADTSAADTSQNVGAEAVNAADTPVSKPVDTTERAPMGGGRVLIEDLADAQSDVFELPIKDVPVVAPVVPPTPPAKISAQELRDMLRELSALDD